MDTRSAPDQTDVEEQPELDTASLFGQVLLIEDEPAHARVLSRALDGIVGEVSLASTGQDAIEAVQTTFPDLVFCDLNLPDASGLELLRRIRDVRPGLPVIIMTSSSSLEHAVAAMREGAWDYMVKDFSESLKNRLAFVIQRAAHRKMQQLREFKLRGERNAFWAAVQRAADGLGILSTEGYVVFANETFNKFCRLLLGEGEPDSSVHIIKLLEAYDPSVARNLEQRLRSGSQDTFWTSELMIELSDSDPKVQRFFELTLSSVRMEEVREGVLGVLDIPELRKYVLWIRDVTRRKERERFQRDLLSTTTHDLKGPLGAILTSAELLAETGSVEKLSQNELVLRIASCARNSITLIDELLSARRIQDGVLIVRPQWFSVHEVLEDTVLDFHPVARAREIDFSAKAVDPELNVYADKIGIHRVLGNLVSNAIKFGGMGGKVRLSAESKGHEVQITVSDTGPGIDPQERSQLFERYQRLEKHGEVEGTGLGLFVSKNIVDAHGGRIDVQSEVGKGTSFVVSFPNEPADQDNESA